MFVCAVCEYGWHFFSWSRRGKASEGRPLGARGACTCMQALLNAKGRHAAHRQHTCASFALPRLPWSSASPCCVGRQSREKIIVFNTPYNNNPIGLEGQGAAHAYDVHGCVRAVPRFATSRLCAVRTWFLCFVMGVYWRGMGTRVRRRHTAVGSGPAVPCRCVLSRQCGGLYGSRG